jgi:hypothetical protein
MKGPQTAFQSLDENQTNPRIHPRGVKFDFHTNPDERPSNGLSEALMKIKRTQESTPEG